MSALGGTAIGGANRSLLGTIGGVIGAIGGFVTGGPGGAVAGATAGQAIGNAINGPGPGQAPTPPPSKPIIGAGGGIQVGGYGINIGGAFTGPNNGPPVTGTAVTTTGCGCSSMPHPCGYHWNKHTLNPTRGGCNRPAQGVRLPGTALVRNRHMNPLNIKALRRADRRAHAFLKISRRVVKHFVAKAPKGKSYIHARRRK